jgi:hypothetical protein
MATNTDLFDATRLWATAVDTSVGTTWQEFKLNALGASTKITIKADGAIYYASSEDGAADAGAVGAVRSTWTAAQASNGIEAELYTDPAKRITSVFVAAQSGTVAVELIQE